MIKQIKLKNFQSHVDTTVELGSGINAFVGHSTAGKTAILRAIQWVLTNRPVGNDYANYSIINDKDKLADEFSVEITFSNGDTVKRIKDKKLNAYIVNSKPLECVGTDVPIEVLRMFNMDSLNIHEQLEPHFMLSMSAGEVAKYLNSLIGLELIDTLISKATSAQRSYKSTIEESKATITKLEKELKAIPDIDMMENLLSIIDTNNDAINEFVNDINTLNTSIDKLKSVGATTNRLKLVLDNAVPLVEHIDAVNAEMGKITNEVATLNGLIKKAKDCNVILSSKKLVSDLVKYSEMVTNLTTEIKAKNDAINVLKSYINDHNKVLGVVSSRDKVNQMVAILEQINGISNRISKGDSLVGELKKNIDNYNATNSTIAQKRTLLNSLIEQMPDMCPLCGGKMGDCK